MSRHLKAKNVGNALPIDYQEHSPLVTTIALALFGLVFGGVGGFATYSLYQEKGLVLPLLIPGTFLLVGIGLLIAMVLSRYKFHLQIDSGGVRFHKSTFLLGEKRWWAEFSGYKGILRKEEFVPGGKGGTPHRNYCLTLLHQRDRKKDIELYRLVSTASDIDQKEDADTRFRAEAEKFSKLLKVSILPKSAKELKEQRELDDLVRSVRDRTPK